MIARIKTNLIKYFFFGNSITNDGYLRLAYLVGRFIVFLPLSLCVTLVLGVYSIFRPVKIFILRCDRSKISFVVEDLEVALRIERHNTRISGAKPALLFAVLDCDSPNKAFTAMYGRVLPFLDDDRPFFRGIIRYTLPNLRIERRYLARRQSENQMIIWAESSPTLSFTDAEKQLGLDLQKNLLVDASKPFVCIALPEKSYYEMKMYKEHPVSESTDLFSALPAWESHFQCIKSLNDAGLDVLRMGQLVENAISSNTCKIIDYASESRSEFGDVWLLGNCKFVIAGGMTGVYWPTSAMNLPVVITDAYSMISGNIGHRDLIIYQLAWSRSEKKLMPFSWIIAQGEGWGHKRSLIEGDIEIVKNTADEITEVVLEMNQRLDGTWIESEEDRELQARFSALRASIPKWQVQPGVRIGAGFLRRYKHLL